MTREIARETYKRADGAGVFKLHPRPWCLRRHCREHACGSLLICDGDGGELLRLGVESEALASLIVGAVNAL